MIILLFTLSCNRIVAMAIFFDLPDSRNAIDDVYALLRAQLLSAAKTSFRITSLLKGMVDPGQIRFYKKYVKYKPKGSQTTRVYEYNSHYLRYSENVVDKKGNVKVRYYTRILPNDEYEKIEKESNLFRYLSLSLRCVDDILEKTKELLQSSFYYNPNDYPDIDSEISLAVCAEKDSEDSRRWHIENRVCYSPEKYKCIDLHSLPFMSRGELLLYEAFAHCGLSPKYEAPLQISGPRHAGKTYYPDFTCECNGKTYYFEYFGMMNDPAYFADACRKIEDYTRHGLVPGHNFIAFCSGDSSAINLEVVVKVLQKIVSGQSLLEKDNYISMPGIVRLDSISSWSLPQDLCNIIAEESKRFIPKKHKTKSRQRNIKTEKRENPVLSTPDEYSDVILKIEE